LPRDYEEDALYYMIQMITVFKLTVRWILRKSDTITRTMSETATGAGDVLKIRLEHTLLHLLIPQRLLVDRCAFDRVRDLQYPQLLPVE
jgi:hypothetical protein